MIRSDNLPKPTANMAVGDDIIVAVISQVNGVINVSKLVVDSGTTRHICVDRNVFTSYTIVGVGEEQVYLGDSKTTPVLGKRMILLKFTSRKTLALSNVLHVSTI